MTLDELHRLECRLLAHEGLAADLLPHCPEGPIHAIVADLRLAVEEVKRLIAREEGRWN